MASHSPGTDTGHGDYGLGRQLAQLVAAEGARAFESGVTNRRIIAAVQDLLGAETALASPMRDLLQRPGFRLLFSDERISQSVGARDALITDLAGTYSPAMVNRLATVIQGCLGEPYSSSPQMPAASVAASATTPMPPAPTPPVAAIPLPVVTVQPNNGLLVGLIALVSLLAGALVMGLAWALMLQREPQQASSPAPKQPERQEAVEPRPPTPEPEPEPDPSPEPTPQLLDQWQACQEDEFRPAPPPQPGDVWWPVVGPENALADARRFCRPDAYTNRSGNVQLASFRDRETAEAFAEELTRDMSHPFRFWVGDPSTR